MRAKRANRKDELAAAAVRLVASRGAKATTIREIARETGVTEGAIYRHYPSKEELYWHAYQGIVDEMVGEEKPLVTGTAHLRHRLREWIRLSYAYYDRSPEAFSYVLLTPHVVSASRLETTTIQGSLFMEMIRRASASGEVRAISPELALSHFSGLLLNVPRLINEGRLEGPASRYVEEVAGVAWRVLSPEVSEQ